MSETAHISIAELPAEFRRRADACRDFAHSRRAAAIWTTAAKLVVEALKDRADDLLTPAEAEREGLGDAETTARKVRQGKLKNHGRKNAPRVRRGDLDLRLSLVGVAEPEDGVTSIGDLQLQAAQSRSGGGR